MNRIELLKLHEEICLKARELMAKKNHDYSGAADTEDAFQNFRFIEATGATTSEIGIFTRLCDKVKRLGGAVARGQSRLQVSDESLEDTIIDLINYAIILRGYLLSKTSPRDPSLSINSSGYCQCSPPVPGRFINSKQARACAQCGLLIP